MARTPVRLNVYDMYWLNEYASTIGVGVFHSGIEVYGVEYAYGGHPFPFSGVFENSPQDAEELGDNFKFRESIEIGETDFSANEVRRMVQLLGQEYRGDRYHLINKNCNHFTAAFAKTLTGQDIPPWINRLASISNSIPFLERWIPQEWLTPVALQQSLEEKSERSLGNNTAPVAAMNYPLHVDNAEEALETCGTSNAPVLFPRKVSATRVDPATAGQMGTNGPQSWLQRFQRRGSESNTRSAPSTTRVSSPTSLSRLWNSIKSLGSEDIPTSSSDANTPDANGLRMFENGVAQNR